MKITTSVADGSGTVDLNAERVRPKTPDLVVDGKEFRHQVTANMLQPTLGMLERSRDGARLEIARRYAAANGLNRVTISGSDDRVGIIAAGNVFLELRQALRSLGLDDQELGRRGVRLLRLGMITPLEPTIINQFITGLTDLIVVEEKRPLIETALKDLLYGRRDAPSISGKRLPDGSRLFSYDGELTSDLLAERLATLLPSLGDFPTVDHWKPPSRAASERSLLPLAARTPYFCSGCPHNTSTKVPSGSLVGGGIGCHAMISVIPGARVGSVLGLTQMGGEGAHWIGMAPFVQRKHLIQNIGDGTFHHSGSLAVRAAVAAGVNITYKLLYNSAVAMTGGQHAIGAMSVPSICAELAAEGVARILITTEDTARYIKVNLPRGVQVWHRDRLIEAQELLATVAGVTVLIHDQECAAELRRKRKRGLVLEPKERVIINERVCEGCGDCGEKSNCLSVQPIDTEFGRKTRIDQSSCNKDYSCLAGDCPSFLTIVPAAGKPRKSASQTLPDEVPPLPEPALIQRSPHSTRIAGVGGSGVVTLAQILCTAAALAGQEVRALDQTGLAQKGGAVVSDIKISDAPIEQANRLGCGECELYLGCDILVAVDPKYLCAADPSRTIAVVSTSEVPTGAMVTDTSAAFPSTLSLREQIQSVTREALFLDARDGSEALFGNDQFANLLLAGAAYQLGTLPIPAAAIEKAIGLNRVQVDANRSAFRHGRLSVADPAEFVKRVERQRPPTASVPAMTPAARAVRDRVRTSDDTELGRLLQIRIPDLVAYQNVAYAKRYAEVVERVRRIEGERVPGSTVLTEAFARYLYKLMTYKDEYEVARLSLDPAIDAAAKAKFGDGARISYRLHPPTLRALGMRNKIELGPWFKNVYRVLVAMRKLRGTPFDPFGIAHLRRIERQLITDYETMIDDLLGKLDSANLDLALQIASLPDMVRGYESIKLGNVDRYHARVKELTHQFGARSPATPAQ